MLRRLVAPAAAAAATAAVVAASTELRTATVAGTSMTPTFETATCILVQRFWPSALSRHGDVVVLRSPEEGCEKDLLTKRVVGLEGDWLYARDGRLVRVPTAHVWVEGDNASNSNDSTHYGPVPRTNLAGTVVAKLWPPAQLGAVADRREACQSRVISGDVATRLRSRPSETGETIRAALRKAREGMHAYTQSPAVAIPQTGSA